MVFTYVATKSSDGIDNLGHYINLIKKKWNSTNNKNAAVVLLYEDEFCKLTSKTLEIKNYLSSNKSSEFVCLKLVRTFYYKRQSHDDSFIALRWGNWRDVCWARDLNRQNPGSTIYNVVIDTGEMHKTGFSISNFENFYKNIKNLLPNNTKIIPNKIPYEEDLAWLTHQTNASFRLKNT